MNYPNGKITNANSGYENYSAIYEAIYRKYPNLCRSQYNPIDIIRVQLNMRDISPIPSQNNYNSKLNQSNFPTDLIDTAEYLSSQSRIDKIGCMCGSLGGVNFALLGTYYVQPKREWREPLIDYWMLLAQPSMMKTAIINSLRFPFDEFQVKLRKEYSARFIEPEVIKKRKKDFEKDAKRRLKEELAKLKGDDRNSIEKVKEAHLIAEEYYQSLTADLTEAIYPQLFWSSGTMKGLAGMMAEQNGCLGVMESEDTFLNENLLTSKLDIEIFLKGWDQGQYHRSVDGKNVLVNNASLPILFAIQNTVGNELFSNKRLSGRGALARFLTYWVPAQKPTEKRSFNPLGLIGVAQSTMHNSNNAYETYCKKINILLDRSWSLRKQGKFIEIPLSPGAKEVLGVARAEFESKLSNPDFQFMEDWLGKAHGFLLRIAGRYPLLE